MERKMIFFDIDGTLTSAKQFGYVYESTREALRLLQENGHFVALATGRAAFRAREFQKQIKIPNMVCEGGNQLVMNDETISYELPDQPVFHQLYALAMQENIGVAVSLEDSRVRISPNELFRLNAGDFSAFMEVQEEHSFALRSEHKIRRMFLAGDTAYIHALVAPYIEKKGIGIMHYRNDCFIILEPDDKYKGIRNMARLLHEEEKQIVVFGDGLNDRQMFRDAPFSIAMGNAIPELKELANYVCPSADDDGIYKACKHFGWI